VKKRVVFICLGNSCRSIMAEALARHFLGDTWGVASGGTNPLGWVTRETLQVLAEIGLATEGLYSKGLAEINLEECQVIVNLADRRLEPFLPPAFKGVLIHRPVLDPYGGSLELYRQTREDLKRLITGELCQLLSPPKTPGHGEPPPEP
jgi:arsenate reductase